VSLRKQQENLETELNRNSF